MHLFDTPFLLIHGKEDVVTSPQMSQHLYDVAVVCLRPLPRIHSVVRAVTLPSDSTFHVGVALCHTLIRRRKQKILVKKDRRNRPHGDDFSLGSVSSTVPENRSVVSILPSSVARGDGLSERFSCPRGAVPRGSLARDWRMDKFLRRLEATLIVTDGKPQGPAQAHAPPARLLACPCVCRAPARRPRAH